MVHEARRGGGGWLRWTLLAALAGVGLWFGGRALAGALPRFAVWVEGLGPLGTAAFVVSYAIATVALVPGSLLTLAAGALFGVARGTGLVLAGATLGATLAFLVARYLARPAVERRLRGDPRFERMDRAIGRHGFKVVFLLRLSPILPFVLLNYALGLTRVRLAQYVVASVGMLPGTLLYVYSGRVVGDVAALASGTAVAQGLTYYLVLGLGLVATIAVTVLLTRIARHALDEDVEIGGPTHAR